MGALGSRLHACSLMLARDFSTPTCFFSCSLSITKKEEEEEEGREEKEEEEKEEEEKEEDEENNKTLSLFSPFLLHFRSGCSKLECQKHVVLLTLCPCADQHLAHGHCPINTCHMNDRSHM